METLIYVGKWIAVVLIIVSWVVVSWLIIYTYWWQDKTNYSKARKEIFEYVKAYKRRCSGANRFVVTVGTLQEVFMEYETEIIEKVWSDLIDERLIQQDKHDNEWCIR